MSSNNNFNGSSATQTMNDREKFTVIDHDPVVRAQPAGNEPAVVQTEPMRGGIPKGGVFHYA